MKVFTIVVALAAAALAAPTEEEAAGYKGCKPGTYACAHNPKGGDGWKVCNAQGKWEYAGDCPPKTKCEFLKANGSPYCIPYW